MIIYSDFARRVRDAVRSLPSFRIDDEDLKLYAWAMRETIDGPVTCSTCGERCPPNDPFGASGCAETPQGLSFSATCRTCAAAVGIVDGKGTVSIPIGLVEALLPVIALSDPVPQQHDQIAALLDSAAQKFLSRNRIEYLARRLTLNEVGVVGFLRGRCELPPRQILEGWAAIYRRSRQSVRIAALPWLDSEADQYITFGASIAEACVMDEALETGDASLMVINGAMIFESSDSDRLMQRVDAARRIGTQDYRRFNKAREELLAGVRDE